ncbi:MAG: c-type cytochrome [Pseudomonadota bacterium]
MLNAKSIRLVPAIAVAMGYLMISVSAANAVSSNNSDEEDPPTIEVTSDNPLTGDVDAIKKGRKLYSTFCAQCHGYKADGVAPRFGDYAADLRVFNKGYYEFVGIVVEGIVDKQMPPWGEYLDGDQMSGIGAYLETLAIEGAVWATEE